MALSACLLCQSNCVAFLEEHADDSQAGSSKSKKCSATLRVNEMK
jgi:hypothetical protein